MFIGYQGENPSLIKETKEELENIPYLKFDSIKEVPFAEMFNGVIYLSEEELSSAKSDKIRKIRDNYLTSYVDPIVTNPLRWGDMSEEEQTQVKNYRSYLLNITDDTSFPEVTVLTFEEWKNSL